MKKTNLHLINTLLVGLFIFLVYPIEIYALNLYTEQPVRELRVGDSVLIKVYLDTEGSEINVIEGSLRLKGKATIKSIHTGGSILNLWPVYPYVDGNNVIFTGGTPSSAFGNRLHVFNLEVIPSEDGELVFETISLVGYLADGNGTKINGILTKSSAVKVEKSNGVFVSDFSEMSEQDRVPPKSFKIEYGKDQNVYEGKVFISFFTTDNLSGLNRYEIKEGDLDMITQTEGVYVLNNQNFEGKIQVTAVDNAGNRRTEKIVFGETDYSRFGNLLWAVTFFVIMFLGFVFFKKKNEKI